MPADRAADRNANTATRPRLYLVNAFCITGEDGNPAAVCLPPEGLDDPVWMQRVARQIAVSETAFLRRTGENGFAVRWFSPVREMPLCGHATLAGAHILYAEGLADDGPIRFTASGQTLAASQGPAGITLDFPAIHCQPAPVPDWFGPAFGIEPVAFLAGPGKYLAELPGERDVRRLEPDFALLRRKADRGVIVTSRSSDDDYDIVSRYFAAYAGVDEDPATGSAHCCLGPYWAERIGAGDIRAHQASPRGGRMLVRVDGRRVLLTGSAHTVLAGTLLI